MFGWLMNKKKNFNLTTWTRGHVQYCDRRSGSGQSGPTANNRQSSNCSLRTFKTLFMIFFSLFSKICLGFGRPKISVAPCCSHTGNTRTVSDFSTMILFDWDVKINVRPTPNRNYYLIKTALRNASRVSLGTLFCFCLRVVDFGQARGL